MADRREFLKIAFQVEPTCNLSLCAGLQFLNGTFLRRTTRTEERRTKAKPSRNITMSSFSHISSPNRFHHHRRGK